MGTESCLAPQSLLDETHGGQGWTRRGGGPTTATTHRRGETTPTPTLPLKGKGSRCKEEEVAEHINGPLYWEQLGKSGLPVAFIHPNPMDHTCWIYQMAHLSSWFRCVGVDLPGYGKSPKASPGLTMQDIAQACWEAIEEVTIEPAIIVGESVGSTVVQHMATIRPDET